MDILLQVQQLLSEKNALLRRFEEITQDMLSCLAQELEGQVNARQQLIERLEQLDEQIAALCSQLPDPQLALAICSGQCNAEELPEAWQPVYLQALQNRSVLSRLIESDLQAALRLRLEQEEILEQIRKNNQGVHAKAARFYAASGLGQNRQSRLGNA